MCDASYLSPTDRFPEAKRTTSHGQPASPARRTGCAAQAPLRVLIIEDGPTVAAGDDGGAAAGRHGDATSPRPGWRRWRRKPSFHPDVVLVDLELPDINGLELVARFAREADCGVIVVSANGAEATRIAGLETGADDYIMKPVPLRELAARIRAVHRRLTRRRPTRSTRGRHPFMDPSRRVLLGPNEASVTLTEAETAGAGGAAGCRWRQRVTRMAEQDGAEAAAARRRPQRRSAGAEAAAEDRRARGVGADDPVGAAAWAM